jgi:phosphatidylglycerol:prolipoprotein diacylglycerol transferase
LYLRQRQVDFLIYADTLAFGLPVGIWLGRLGCFLIHDHPGTATHFLLGTRYPDGVVRHDLGLYESLAAFLMAGVFLLSVRRPRLTGTYLAIFAIWYGALRFGLDFLRIIDSRYLGLTAGQYLGLVLIISGLGLSVWIRKGLKKA